MSAIPGGSAVARSSYPGCYVSPHAKVPFHHHRQSGRGSRAPLHHTGIAVANLRVAVTQRVQQDGEWRDGDTSFLNVNVWRGQVERVSQRGNGERSSGRGAGCRAWWRLQRDRALLTDSIHGVLGSAGRRSICSATWSRGAVRAHAVREST